MTTYKLTFGTGKDKVTFIEENCVTFSEAVLRLEYTGLQFEELTKVEKC